MSLRWRIMASTILIVVLTVGVSVGVGYYAAQSRLGVFVNEIGGEEASQLAKNLSLAYTAAGGWQEADAALSDAGYIYSGVAENDGTEEGQGEHSESFHEDRVRVVIVDADGRVVKDNLSELPPGAVAPDLDGHRETIFDLASSRPVGQVYVDVNREFLSSESHGFLRTLLYIALIGGALTAVVAILLAAWLSKRITAPVTALTEATQVIAHGETAQLPVNSSDELGLMTAAFNRMTSALDTQRELRRRLINDVTHELNTPLSVIKLEAKALRDGLQGPESATDHIIQEVDRLAGLVTDLDWLAETDRGELRLAIEVVSVHGLVASEVGRWQPQAQAREVGLTLELSDDLTDVSVDRMRMSQALGNVIGNAISCTEPGGNIVVRAGLESDEGLTITVTDDGIGIHPEDLPHVFDRFYRTDQARRHGIGGTGLGLAIARAIVEAHEGTIAVGSGGPGKGVTVTIRLSLGSEGPFC